MSQTELANTLDISFQQIQKYETALNRLSISRLHDIADVLKVNPSTFFRSPSKLDKEILDHKTTKFIRLFQSVPDPTIQETMLNLIEGIVDSIPKDQSTTH